MERLSLALPGGRFVALAEGPRTGPLALCVHGFPDVAETFSESGLLSALGGSGYRAVAPYLRGYAPSTLAGPFDADRLARDLVELADALSPGRPAALVGHDWGAVAAYLALAVAPGRFSRAVTLAVPHPLAFFRNLLRHPSQLRRSGYMAVFQLPGLPERTLRLGGFAWVEELWRRWSPGYAPSRRHLDRVTGCLDRSLPAPLGPYRAMGWPPVSAGRRLARAAAPDARIRVPTLHLHGGDDGCIGPALRAGQDRHFQPGALAQGIVPDAGHFLHLERPDVVAARVLAWLDGG
jgi:pimeloyl-ACP methyl ester carboxylesterase